MPDAARRLRVPAVGPSGRVEFDGAAARKIAKVLRLRPGDYVVAVDAEGVAHRVRLGEVSPARVSGEAVDRVGGLGRPARPVALFVALAKRIDEAIEKAAEAGAARIVPLRAARSVGRAPGAERLARWRRIAEGAAAQCGRADVPEVAEPRTFDAALAEARSFGRLFVLHTEGAGENLLAALAEARGPVSLLVGPEGGFAPEEVASARAAGAREVSLGDLTLRVETACAVAVWAAARSPGPPA